MLRKALVYLRLSLIPICLLVVLATSTAVYAFIDQPDTMPSFSNIFVNRNLLTLGDMLVHGTCYIPYSSEPPIISSEAFYIRLLSSNGIVEYASIHPYVFFNNGYNQIAFSLYLSDNATWGTECILRLSENPYLFASPINFDTVLLAGHYSLETTQDANQSELAEKIIDIAEYLQPYYPLNTFLQSLSGSFILSSPDGETYFTGVIPLLQYMAPSLFLLQSFSADISSENWTTAEFDIYEQRFSGNWVGYAVNATATQFNITPMMVTSIVLIIPLCIGAVIVSSRKYQRAEPGYIFCSIVLILGAVMGWIPAAIFAAINQLEGIYIGYILFYARG